MNTTLKALLLAIIAFGVVFYIDARINAYDMAFYQGKDDGLSARVYSVIFLSALLFTSYGRQHKIRAGLMGALVGFIASVLGFIISYLVFREYDLTFHIVALCLVLLFFIGIKRVRYLHTTKNERQSV